MKVQFLGTSASPAIPLPFCNCKICTTARKIGGKNLRKRSSIKINEDLIIDIGPDIMSSSFEHDIPLSDISICLQTHFHEDHFDPEMIISRHSDYGSIISNELLIVGSKETIELMDEIICRRYDYGSIFESKLQSDLRIKLMLVSPFESYSIGDYIVTGYPANHGLPEQGCMIFKIGYKDKSLLYGIDTSIIFEEVWEHFKVSNSTFDLIILDHTYGIGYNSKQGDHLAIKDFITHVQRFYNNQVIKKNAQIYATHISHEGIMEHSELDNYSNKHNYHIAYDGLIIEI